MQRKHLLILVSAIAILLVSLTLTTSAARAAPSQPKANWSPCYPDQPFPFECTTVKVPLDYDGPGTATISIAMVRLPAADPDNRIGSLFLNPGGPGGSGVDFALNVAPILYTPEVRARFDIVGFDPRGIARSKPLRCFGTPGQWTGYFTPFPYPTSPEEEAIWQDADQFLVDACDQRARRILDNMTTADAARDLDLLRQAVGDDKLTYAGFSYGSMLGNTYANLFPDNVRALVIDAVLDPVAWTTGRPDTGDLPFSTRLRSDVGAQATLDEFFRLCDAGGFPTCAFAPDAAARYDALVNQLRSEPIIIPIGDGNTIQITDAVLIAESLGAMYNSMVWPQFAQFLAGLEALAMAPTADVTPADVGDTLTAYWQAAGFVNKRGDPAYPNAVEGFPGVACSDSDNPGNYQAWSDAAAARAEVSTFGPIWTWASSICANWPGAMDSRYAGPFTAGTANPVLVVGNLYDPATPYHGAQTVANMLPNARLLTVDGWGHASLFLSQCATNAVAAYLVHGTLPAEGTVCHQDIVPFLGPAGAAATDTAAARALITPAMTPDIVHPHNR